MMIRIRSRDGLERVSIENSVATVAQLKSEIESQLRVPVHAQILSTNQNFPPLTKVKGLLQARLFTPLALLHYVNETLAFAVKRGGLMYGTVSEEGKVEVDFIYEPPQQGTEENLILLRDPDEEKLVEAIALGLGMRKGICNRKLIPSCQDDKRCWLREENTTCVLEVSDIPPILNLSIIKEFGPSFLDISHREQEIPVTMKALKNHLDRAKGLPFVKRISDFHLLLLLARFLDINADVPALAGCVQTQATIPEGYQLLIESLASAS
ncbi:NPL4-like protein 2 [Sesamum angolense]|uniref:NPL4-like protein 2 n=1 Tax=Sesamum angolense TaxID=2727404 RepID=A0AAE2BGZ6_9LAMI|nr:NPL4-like protein 2 [Sesamum angolense]